MACVILQVTAAGPASVMIFIMILKLSNQPERKCVFIWKVNRHVKQTKMNEVSSSEAAVCMVPILKNIAKQGVEPLALDRVRFRPNSEY